MLDLNDLPDDWDWIGPVPDDLNDALERFARAEPSGTAQWEEVENSDNGMRLALRAQDDESSGRPIGISGMVVLPPRDAPTLTGGQLRNVPLAEIQRAMRGRTTESWARYLIRGALTAGPSFKSGDPIGENDGTDAFYARVALTWMEALDSGETQPTNALHEATGTPLSTVRRWVAEARKRDLLPTDLHGRAGRRSTRRGSDGDD